VHEQILAIRDLVIRITKDTIEESAKNKIGDTASADGSDHTVHALDRNAAQTPMDTNVSSKNQRLMFASYSTPDNAHESSASAVTVEEELECYLRLQDCHQLLRSLISGRLTCPSILSWFSWYVQGKAYQMAAPVPRDASQLPA